MITLPHSANQNIPVEKFLAAWIIWVERFHNSSAWEGFHFPFDWQKEALALLIGGGRLSGLDTMQISDTFLTDNSQWLSKCNDALSSRDREVAGVF